MDLCLSGDGEGLRDALCRNLYQTAFSARLCPDIILRAFGGIHYPSHRVILASQSQYFSTLLRYVQWRQPFLSNKSAILDDELDGLPVHDLVLGEDVSQRGFEWVLEYFYASPHLSLTPETALDVLAAAHFLGVHAVQSAVLSYLVRHLQPATLPACLAWASRRDVGPASETLAAACRTSLALRLPYDLPQWCTALPRIEPAVLVEVLAGDRLAVGSEYERYELVKQVAAALMAAAAAGTARAASCPEGPPAGAWGADIWAGPCEQGGRSAAAAADGPPSDCEVGDGSAASGSSSGAASGSSSRGLREALSWGASVGVASPREVASTGAPEAGGMATDAGWLAEAEGDGAPPANVQVEACGRQHGPFACCRSASEPLPAAAAAATCTTSAAAPALTDAAAAELTVRQLYGAVRYEHLTPRQLMSVMADGHVDPAVLHAALWRQTALSLHLGAAGGGAGAGFISSEDEVAGAAVDGGDADRPFRICWRLSGGSLRGLKPGGSLQSGAYGYAGVPWVLRLVRVSEDEGRSSAADGGSVGVYIGRRGAPPGSGAVGPSQGSLTHGSVSQAAPRLGPDQDQDPRRRQYGGRRRPAALSPRCRHADAACSQPPPPPSQPALLSARCRLSLWQPDSAALGGRMCLGDSGEFERGFVAGGLYGSGRVAEWRDVEALVEGGQLLVLASLQVAVPAEP